MSIIDNIKESLLAGVTNSDPPGPIAEFIVLAVEPILKSTGMTDEILESLDPEEATKIVTDMTDKIKTMVVELSTLHIDLLVGFVLILAKYIPGIKADFDADAESTDSESTNLASDT